MKPLGSADPTVIASYHVLGLLGSGGMARVYLARSSAGRRLAIKVIRAELAQNPLIRRRFAHEVAALRKVNPLFTAPIVDADIEADEPWLATTFIDGPSLDDWVTGHGPLGPGAVLTLAAGLAEALASIHNAGLVHRDVKPGNVLLDDAGPHIIDFGVALLDDATRLTVSLVGTPAYMAPERLRGEDGTPEADMFSLGATLAFAATGKGLVGGDTVYAQVMQIAAGRIDLSGVPPQLRDLIAWCLNRRPKDRPTAADLVRVLSASGVRMAEPGWYRDGSAPVTAVVRTPIRPLSRHGTLLSRRRVLAIGGLCVAAGGIAIGTISTLPRGRASAAPQPTGTRTVRVRWQLRSGARTGGQNGPPPGERVIVYPPDRVVAVRETEIVGLDTTGKQVWNLSPPLEPVVCWRWGDAVLVAEDTHVRLLDAATGATRAIGTLPAPVLAAAVLPDRAFLATDSGLLTLDRSLSPGWQRPSVPGAPGPRDDVVLTVDSGHLVIQERYGGTIRVSVADPDTGELRGSTAQYTVPPPSQPSGPPRGNGQGQEDPDGGGRNGPPPQGPPPELRQRFEARLAADLAVLRFSQDVRALRLADQSLIWQYASENPIADVEVVGDRVLVAAGQLVALDLDTGHPQWKKPPRGAGIAAYRDGILVLAASDQSLMVLDGNGGITWQASLPASTRGAMPDRLIVDGDTLYATFHLRPEDSATVDVVAFALS